MFDFISQYKVRFSLTFLMISMLSKNNSFSNSTQVSSNKIDKQLLNIMDNNETEISSKKNINKSYRHLVK